MRRRWLICAYLLLAGACRPIGAEIVTPTAVPAATSYVAPLSNVAPTPEQSTVPTVVPEELTSLPEIITVEPAVDTTTTPTTQP